MSRVAVARSNGGDRPARTRTNHRTAEPDRFSPCKFTASIRQAIEGPFAAWLADVDMGAWRAFLFALFGEQLSRSELQVYAECTRRKKPPKQLPSEAWVIVGRRGGKSRIAALIAVYIALYGRWRIAAGETARVLVVATSKAQAKIIKDYASALLASNAALRRRIAKEDQFSVTLSNGIEIAIATNSYRSVRGPTVVAAIFEEVAFWHSEFTANPDKEVYRAVKPAMASVAGALLIGISSPYAERGILFERYRRYFGRENAPVLVWQAETRRMNPTIPQAFIDEALAEDPESAKAEFLARFRQDVSTYLAQDALERVIDAGVRERPPREKTRYFAFVDPAGGSGTDAMVLVIAHLEKVEGADLVFIDAIRERRPKFSPQSVVSEFSEVLRAYRIREIVGDRFAGEWAREPFSRLGFSYRLADRSKSDLYRDLLPVINSCACRFIDDDRLKGQLLALERRVGRRGDDVIDHPPHQQDDIANACAGAICIALAEARRPKARTSLFAPIFVRGGGSPLEEFGYRSPI